MLFVTDTCCCKEGHWDTEDIAAVCEPGKRVISRYSSPVLPQLVCVGDYDWTSTAICERILQIFDTNL